ncbi:putative hemolysin [Pilibacter termitis]|uniref:Putative hemolysin n=1 Tax=Pilibacter termitis TaxID=263852 RepID=A0A1T4K5A4_9ENTE|nr:hemolysin family protein [Pilibacter termitis]SJZ37620.1 putative hemolysin [Pilibacter termitis]
MNGDPESQSILVQILILLLLTALNAFFSASEMAMISLNKNRITQKAEEEDDKKSKKILKILEDPNKFLSTIQVGITVINILAGASLADTLAGKLSAVLGGGATAKNIATILVLAFLTYFSIVFGELYPKRIALNLNEKIAGISVTPIKAFGTVLSPFVWLLSASTNLLSRITPMEFDDETSKMTRDEMAFMLTNEGTLEETEVEMLQGVFSLDDKVAREVMVPRTDAFMIDIENNLHENIQKVLGERFSRVPVYEDDKDKIIGILHTKTLLTNGYYKGWDNVNLREILQEPLFVPETIFIDDLLTELKRTQNQMAILLDEYSGVAGLVTLEDLLEEIVGEIDDETDEKEVLFSQIGKNEYIIQGRMLIDEFNEEFDTNLEMDDVDTMAGYFLTAVGTIPDEHEEISYDVDNDHDHLTLHKEKMEGTRVSELRVLFREIEPLVVEESEESGGE